MPAFSLRGLDFLFILSFIFGLYALHRELAIAETGQTEEGVVLRELYGEVRKSVRHVSNVAGLRTLTYFPFARIRDVLRGNANRRGDRAPPEPSAS